LGRRCDHRLRLGDSSLGGDCGDGRLGKLGRLRREARFGWRCGNLSDDAGRCLEFRTSGSAWSDGLGSGCTKADAGARLGRTLGPPGDSGNTKDKESSADAGNGDGSNTAAKKCLKPHGRKIPLRSAYCQEPPDKGADG
jgi:hypothetical protein